MRRFHQIRCSRFQRVNTMAHAGGAPLIQPLVIFVADIRGYTELSETVSIQSLTAMMTQWFQETQECIERHNGAVDKFIGDCVMARWMLNPDPARIRQAPVLRPHGIYISLPPISPIAFLTLGIGFALGLGSILGWPQLILVARGLLLGILSILRFVLRPQLRRLVLTLCSVKARFSIFLRIFWRGRRKHIKVKGKRDELEVAALGFDDLPQAQG